VNCPLTPLLALEYFLLTWSVYDAYDTQSGTDADRSRAAAAENRVRVLEKQRAELMEGFRKQLKLIDILKRQKVPVRVCVLVM
jgi:uncharacterized membrane protein